MLQDIHWSLGLLGYFPTYTLGSLAAAQLVEACERALGPLEPLLARLELAPIGAWLREHVHRHGSRYPPDELLERATGAPLGERALLDQLRRMCEAAYGTTSN
jgi:carboxypeptidase Taq